MKRKRTVCENHDEVDKDNDSKKRHKLRCRFDRRFPDQLLKRLPFAHHKRKRIFDDGYDEEVVEEEEENDDKRTHKLRRRFHRRSPEPPPRQPLTPLSVRAETTSSPSYHSRNIPKSKQSTTSSSTCNLPDATSQSETTFQSPPTTEDDAMPSLSNSRLPSPPSHVYTHLFDPQFWQKVQIAYTNSEARHARRVEWYGADVANEWKRGSTPQTARDEWMNRWQIMEQDEEASDSSDYDAEQRAKFGVRYNGP